MQVIATEYGRAALVELHRVVDTAKHDDPLAPVTVLVPSNYVGVATRRALGSGGLGPVAGRRGLAGIDLLTTYRLAELLGAPRLAAAGRRPLSTPVVAAAVRQVLAAGTTMFTAVSDHPSTERALVRVHRELRDLTNDQLDAIAGRSERARQVVEIHRAVTAALAPDWYDEFDLFDSATDVLADHPHRARERGEVVLYLPQQLTAAAVRLLRAVSDHAPVTIVAGYTGAPGADRLATEMLARLLAPVEPPAPPAVIPPVGSRVVSVSDADDEVRAVLRDLVAAVLDGTPLEQMAVLHGADHPYARLLEEHLDAAGIPHNGATVRSIDESVVGRTVLALLDLPEGGFRRTDVMALLASAPVRRSDAERGLAPVAEWERLSRQAGIVEGADEWDGRLRQLTADLADDLARITDPDDPAARRIRRTTGRLEALRTFVTELVDNVDPRAVPGSWRGKAAWLRALVERYLGAEHQRTGWPDIEHVAAEKLDEALDRLAALDEIDPDPPLATFRRSLELELEGSLGRSGALGEGVFVGRVGQALGIDLRHVFVLGMAEGLMPARQRDDSLLPDAERAAADGALRLATARVDEDHRALLTALAAAPRRTLYFPRGDLRRSSEHMASRWLLDTIEVHNGERAWSDDLHPLARRGVPWLHEVPSYVGGLRATSFPASEQEYELRSLLDHHERGEDLGDHDLVRVDASFARGLDLARSRRAERFTRFDGNLAGIVTPEGVRIDVVSPTRLETWAACPHRYLMEQVLRVDVAEQPEALLQISPLDRGSLVHDALDRCLSEVLEAGVAVPGPGEPWPPEVEDRLVEIAEELCEHYASRGLVGKQLFWRQDRSLILDELRTTLRSDATRSDRGRLVACELDFGLPGSVEGPVEHRLDDDLVLHFRGSADRVERTDEGRLVVIDYKTGSTRAFAGIDDPTKDPVKKGTKLQLPVYALAARRAHGPDAPVHAAYWFVSRRGGFKWIGYDVDDAVMRRFDEAVRTIVEGIRAGLFPSHPSGDHYQHFVECPYCDPDGLGTLGRRREWERKRHDPELRPYRLLAEPEELLDD